MKEKHQHHYEAQGIQPITIMQENFSANEYEGYLKGNVLKYLLRYRLKNGAEDLRKAMVYLEWLIEHVGLFEDEDERIDVAETFVSTKINPDVFVKGSLPNDVYSNDVLKETINRELNDGINKTITAYRNSIVDK